MDRFLADPLGIIVDALVIGLFDAGPLVLAAIGFTLIYYLNGFINVAYGETLAIGAYTALIFNAGITTLPGFAELTFELGGGLNFWLSIIPAALVAGLASVAMFLFIFRPAMRRGVGPTEMIILSVGLSFAIRYSMRLIFGPRNKNYDPGDVTILEVLGQFVADYQLISLVLAAAFVIGLYLFIYRTDYGKRMRALAGNRDLAAVSGIDPVRVSALIWFVAGVAGGLAGIFIGVFSRVYIDVGWDKILIIIMIVIVGTVGSVRGAFLAAIGAAILVAFMAQVTQPLYGEVALLVLFIIILKLQHTRQLARA
jgi:branched-subunit amino acid ABC-type transport system permease component